MFSQLRQKVEVENALLSKLKGKPLDSDNTNWMYGDNDRWQSSETAARTAAVGKAKSDSGLSNTYDACKGLKDGRRPTGGDAQAQTTTAGATVCSPSSSESDEIDPTTGTMKMSPRRRRSRKRGKIDVVGAESPAVPRHEPQPLAMAPVPLLHRSISVPEQVKAGDQRDSSEDGQEKKLLTIIDQLVRQIEDMGGTAPAAVSNRVFVAAGRRGEDRRRGTSLTSYGGDQMINEHHWSVTEATIAALQQENDELRRRLDEVERYYDAADMRSEEHISELTSQLAEMHDVLVERERQMHLADSRAEDSAKELEQLSAKVRTLEANVSRQKDVIEQLREDIDRQKDRSREAAKERDELLLRNASLTRELEWVRREGGHEREHILDEVEQLSGQLEHYKLLLQQKEDKEQDATAVDVLKSKVSQLEETLRDREATIRLQQFRLNDLKKTLQKEFRLVNSEPTATGLRRSPPPGAVAARKDVDRDATTFQYLRNVLLRFVTSTDYEAMQLIRAVATLLELTQDEEKLIWDTLQWKMSWLPYSKPKHVQNHCT